MISSLLAAERVVGRSPVTLPHRVRAFCCLSEATGCLASLRTGMPIPCSSRTAMSRRTPGTIKTARLSNHRCTTSSAALYRQRKEDFGELRHYDGISPAWPISYDEMEPYYTKAEQLYQVHGARGEDPIEPPSSAPYPYPPVSHEPRIQKLSDDLERAGYHPFHAPCGIMLNEDNRPFSACIRCSNVDGFPCLLHAKSDAEVIGVRPALEYPNVTLLTNTGPLSSIPTRLAPP